MDRVETRGHVVVIGGGITGLVAAHRLTHPASGTPTRVTVIEADDRCGGKIRTSSFAGVEGVDEGPDSYLARVIAAGRLSRELGLGDTLTNPTDAHACVMHAGLHPIPAGLMMGVPTGVGSLARSGLLTWRGKVRAALEPVLPSSGDHGDSVGTFVRQRFGKQVHELLVDPLVGGIYAADTNNFSLATVPQLADLAGGRSVLLTARRRLRLAPPTSGPVFETPRAGLSAIIDSLVRSITEASGSILTSTSVAEVVKVEHGLRVHTNDGRAIAADAVIVTSPAAMSADMMRTLSTEVASTLAATEHASVVMVTMQIPTHERFTGMSGYLVPKPDQQRVTAVSFGSNKWAHWRPADGTTIVRASLGRDGVPTRDLTDEWDDDRLVRRVVDEMRTHTGVDVSPLQYRVTRWPASFPQYRPRHLDRIDDIERALANTTPTVLLAGASMRGIGIASCITQAEAAATRTLATLADATHLRD